MKSQPASRGIGREDLIKLSQGVLPTKTAGECWERHGIAAEQEISSIIFKKNVTFSKDTIN